MLRIIQKAEEKREKIYEDGRHRYYDMFIMNNGDMGTLRELCGRYLNYQTVRSRKTKYGIFSPLLWVPKITPELEKKYFNCKYSGGGIEDPGIKWDRSRCKRDSVPCKSYAECQAKRIGLPSAGAWVDPGSTDCYTAPKADSLLKACCPMNVYSIA